MKEVKKEYFCVCYECSRQGEGPSKWPVVPISMDELADLIVKKLIEQQNKKTE